LSLQHIIFSSACWRSRIGSSMNWFVTFFHSKHHIGIHSILIEIFNLEFQ
jgi:hypothetical protein